MTSPETPSIRTQLRQARKNAGDWPQTRLAKELGVSERTIKRWEQKPDGRPPEPATLEALLAVLPLDRAAFLRAIHDHRLGAVKINLAGGEVAALISQLRSEATQMAISLGRLQELLAGPADHREPGEPR